MRARVTLGVGLPYQTDRVTLAAGLYFVYISHVNASGRVTLASGSSVIRAIMNARSSKNVLTR